jgi:hypothetical protein
MLVVRSQVPIVQPLPDMQSALLVQQLGICECMHVCELVSQVSVVHVS